MFQNVVKDDKQEMSLWMLDVASREFNPVQGAYYYPCGWVAGDKSLFVMDFPEDWAEPDNILYRLDLRTGLREIHASIPAPPKELSSPEIAPDGRTIVFLRRKDESDIWLVEDFDPDVD